MMARLDTVAMWIGYVTLLCTVLLGAAGYLMRQDKPGQHDEPWAGGDAALLGRDQKEKF